MAKMQIAALWMLHVAVILLFNQRAYKSLEAMQWNNDVVSSVCLVRKLLSETFLRFHSNPFDHELHRRIYAYLKIFSCSDSSRLAMPTAPGILYLQEIGKYRGSSLPISVEHRPPFKKRLVVFEGSWGALRVVDCLLVRKEQWSKLLT